MSYDSVLFLLVYPLAFGLLATVLGAWLRARRTQVAGYAALLVAFWFLPAVLRLCLVSLLRVSAFALFKKTMGAFVKNPIQIY